MSRRILISVTLMAVTIAASSVACGKSSPPGGTQPTGLFVGTIFPNSGPLDAEVIVRINGAGFQTGATATLGGAPMAIISVTGTAIMATTPNHAAGVVDLVVTNPDGRTGLLASAFSYAPMSVSTLSPNRGLSGSFVRVSGFGFQSGVSVTVDGASAQTFPQSSTVVFFYAPAHAAGLVDVVVDTPSGQHVRLANGFTYDTMTLTASTNIVAAGGLLSVTWVAPPNRDHFDWIGLFRIGAASTDFLQFWWEYNSTGASSGTKTLAAPTQPGEYEFRYFVDDGFIDAARTTPVTVTATPPAPRNRR